MNEDLYRKSAKLTGGHLADIPLPHIRFFPNPYFRRKVTITISRFYGYGPHYYVSISQESNPIWNGKEWQIAWDDLEGKGKTDTDLYFAGDLRAKIRVEAYQLAIGKAKQIINKYFSDHEQIWIDYCQDYEPG